MDIAVTLLACSLAASISVILWLIKLRKRDAKHLADILQAAKQKDKEPTYDCRELLHDLTAGAGLVKIVPISPLDVYIRRS